MMNYTDLLMKIEDHNLWLTSKGRIGEQLTLLNEDLSGMDLSYLDMSGAVLENCSLNGTNLTKTNFNHTVIIDCSLEDANLNQTDFSLAVLRGIDFTHNDIRNTKLSSTRSCFL